MTRFTHAVSMLVLVSVLTSMVFARQANSHHQGSPHSAPNKTSQGPGANSSQQNHDSSLNQSPSSGYQKPRSHDPSLKTDQGPSAAHPHPQNHDPDYDPTGQRRSTDSNPKNNKDTGAQSSHPSNGSGSQRD